MLQGNELFAAQEAEGDQIRRERRQPEPEFVRTVIRYVTIYEWSESGERWPGLVLHDTYEEARYPPGQTDKVRVAAVRVVRIDL